MESIACNSDYDLGNKRVKTKWNLPQNQQRPFRFKPLEKSVLTPLSKTSNATDTFPNSQISIVDDYLPSGDPTFDCKAKASIIKRKSTLL